MGEANRRKKLDSSWGNTQYKVPFNKKELEGCITFYVYKEVVLANNWNAKNNFELFKTPQKCNQYLKHKDLMDNAVRHYAGKRDGIYKTNNKGVETHLDFDRFFLHAMKMSETSLEIPFEIMAIIQFLGTRGDVWEPTKIYGTYCNPETFNRFAIEIHSVLKNKANCTILTTHKKTVLESDFIIIRGIPGGMLALETQIERYEQEITKD